MSNTPKPAVSEEIAWHYACQDEGERLSLGRNQLEFFTTAFFHHPEALEVELTEAGFEHEYTLAIEGVGSILMPFDDYWNDEAQRDRLLEVVRELEDEPSLKGVSTHLMAVGRKRGA